MCHDPQHINDRLVKAMQAFVEVQQLLLDAHRDACPDIKRVIEFIMHEGLPLGDALSKSIHIQGWTYNIDPSEDLQRDLTRLATRSQVMLEYEEEKVD